MTKTDFPSEKQLIAELHQLQQLLATQKPSAQEFLLLARFISSEPKELWDQLLQQHGLSQWLTLPLDAPAYPALEKLLGKIQELQNLARTDSLTGLFNRRLFDQTFDMEIERANRHNLPLSIAILDLDDFKTVNDTYGHLCGDEVLQQTGRLLLREIRKTDTAARIGGEEFAILLPGTGLVRARIVLERILNALRTEQIYCAETLISVTCSIGMACHRGGSLPNREAFLATADKALYTAKNNGKNRLEYTGLLGFGEELDQTLVHQNEKQFLLS